MPSNDALADALPLTVGETYTGSTLGATVEPYENWAEYYGAGASVWYRIEPMAAGTITLDTFGSDFDTVLFVGYAWPDFPASVELLNWVEFNDDAEDVMGLQSQVSFSYDPANGDYYVAVGGFDGITGNYVLNTSYASPPPPPPLPARAATSPFRRSERRLGIAELPFAFLGGAAKNPEEREFRRQLQANNDHLMSEMRKLTRHMNETIDAINELARLVQSTPRS